MGTKVAVGLIFTHKLMIKVKARIKLYPIIRKFPIVSGYRPIFNFDNKMSSGSINLLGIEKLFADEDAEVEIRFVNRQYLGDNFGEGSTFTFGEGPKPLGEGQVLRVIND